MCSAIQDIFPNAAAGLCAWHKARNIGDALRRKGATDADITHIEEIFWRLVKDVCELKPEGSAFATPSTVLNTANAYPFFSYH
jgi:hypothetical protein